MRKLFFLHIKKLFFILFRRQTISQCKNQKMFWAKLTIVEFYFDTVPYYPAALKQSALSSDIGCSFITSAFENGRFNSRSSDTRKLIVRFVNVQIWSMVTTAFATVITFIKYGKIKGIWLVERKAYKITALKLQRIFHNIFR